MVYLVLGFLLSIMLLNDLPEFVKYTCKLLVNGVRLLVETAGVKHIEADLDHILSGAIVMDICFNPVK